MNIPSANNPGHDHARIPGYMPIFVYAAGPIGALIFWLIDPYIDEMLLTEISYQEQLYQLDSIELYFRGIVSFLLILTSGVTGTMLLFYKKATDVLLSNEIKYSRAVINTPDAVIISRLADGQILYCNPSTANLTGYAPTELIDRPAMEIHMWQRPEDREELLEVLTSVGEVSAFEAEFKNRDETIYTAYLSASLVTMDDEQCMVSVARDITERKHNEERVRHIAHHDPLTGLPNRILLMDRLDQAIARSRRNETMLSIMFIDLDNFKAVNDTAGHTVGDKVLSQIGKKLLAFMRETDTVARIGGDEFIVLVTDVKSQSVVLQIATKIHSLLCESITVDGVTHDLGASIGITLYPEHAAHSEGLITLADKAMYRAKEDTEKIHLYTVPATES